MIFGTVYAAVGGGMESFMLMFLILLIIPLIMIVFGSLLEKKPPKRINYFIGYRTTRSIKNMDTWKFANEHAGRTWRLAGWIALGVSIIATIAVNVLSRIDKLGMDFGFALYFVAALLGAQFITLIVTIFPTESALKKTFDKNGKRINSKKQRVK